MVQNIPPRGVFCLLELARVWNYSKMGVFAAMYRPWLKHCSDTEARGRNYTMREWGEKKKWTIKTQRQWEAGSVTPHGSAAQLWQSTFMHIDGTRHGGPSDWAVTQWRAAGNSSCCPINQWPARTPRLLFNCQLADSPGEAAFSFTGRPWAGHVLMCVRVDNIILHNADRMLERMSVLR